MRILPTALIASVVIHTGAIAWAVAHKIEPPVAVTLAAPAPIEIQTVPPQEIAVALLDDHTIAAIPHSSSQSGPTGTSIAAKTQTGRISTGHATTTETPAPAEKPKSGLMTMRHPEISQGPSDKFWKAFEDNTKPLQPKSIDSERISDDVASEKEHLNNQRWITNATSEEVYDEREKQVASREEQDGHELQQDGTGTKANHATFTGHVEADGTAHIEKKRSYDPTEILMNRHNMDPYASNKKKFLDGTREERYEIGKVYKEKQLAQSAVLAQKNLAYLWAKTTDTAERKEALFEMWDECAETGADSLVAGGTAARKMIAGFIRGHLKDATAYTATELAAFNAKKKSSAVFDPYNE
jgi:hypothetical protein